MSVITYNFLIEIEKLKDLTISEVKHRHIEKKSPTKKNFSSWKEFALSTKFFRSWPLMRRKAKMKIAMLLP